MPKERATRFYSFSKHMCTPGADAFTETPPKNSSIHNIKFLT